MADFDDLDPQTRCFALVGQFLQAWSVMENSLHTAIGAALAIEPIKIRILCANMRFRDKIHVLGTLFDVGPYFGEQNKEQMRKDLRSLADYSSIRNMMAHDPFRPDESQKGVEFLTVKAKGRFGLPDIIWGVEKFQTELKQIDQYRAFLEELATAFKAQPIPPTNYASALLRFLPEYGQGDFLPMQHMMSPALQDHLSRQAQAVPDLSLDPSTGEIKPQTPPKPEE
jgi:hypothetical protein